MKYSGFLFSLLNAFDTKSEGSIYFLQPFSKDLKNPIHKIAALAIPIQKHEHAWDLEKDLEPYVGKKVTIEGNLDSGLLVYEKVTPCKKEDEVSW